MLKFVEDENGHIIKAVQVVDDEDGEVDNGKTIDEKCYLYGSCKCQTAGCVVRPDNGCPVYRYFKDIIVKDYENRLKADLAAMLDELDLEVCEQYDDTDLIKVKYVRQAIQQKINKLKGGNDGL